MAKKANKSTLAKAGAAVKKAAQTVAETTEQYVVEPVSKALGVKGKKKMAKQPASKKPPQAKAVKSGAAKSTAKKPAAKKTTAKRK
jgi:hypothetical protein